MAEDLRIPVAAVLDTCEALLAAAGLSRDRARVTARVFVDAETLGFVTHGLHRLLDNLEWLTSGSTRADGDVRVVADRAASFCWDADYLPGPYVMSQAVQQALDRAERSGVACGVVSRVQHVACLAAYCLIALERQRVLIVLAGSPAERVVAPPGGRRPLLSTNPIAAAFPGREGAILFDTSTSMLSMGEISAATREQRAFKQAGVLAADGTATSDWARFEDYERTPLLPLGGLQQGYKGFAFGLLVEALTHALGGFGRTRQEASGEENAVCLLAFNPECFGGQQRFLAEVDGLLASLGDVELLEPRSPARAPGQRALASRAAALAEGLCLAAETRQELLRWADRFGIDVRWPEA